jgi:hypothetical protein
MDSLHRKFVVGRKLGLGLWSLLECLGSSSHRVSRVKRTLVGVSLLLPCDSDVGGASGNFHQLFWTRTSLR